MAKYFLLINDLSLISAPTKKHFGGDIIKPTYSDYDYDVDYDEMWITINNNNKKGLFTIFSSKIILNYISFARYIVEIANVNLQMFDDSDDDDDVNNLVWRNIYVTDKIIVRREYDTHNLNFLCEVIKDGAYIDYFNTRLIEKACELENWEMVRYFTTMFNNNNSRSNKYLRKQCIFSIKRIALKCNNNNFIDHVYDIYNKTYSIEIAEFDDLIKKSCRDNNHDKILFYFKYVKRFNENRLLKFSIKNGYYYMFMILVFKVFKYNIINDKPMYQELYNYKKSKMSILDFIENFDIYISNMINITKNLEKKIFLLDYDTYKYTEQSHRVLAQKNFTKNIIKIFLKYRSHIIEIETNKHNIINTTDAEITTNNDCSQYIYGQIYSTLKEEQIISKLDALDTICRATHYYQQNNNKILQAMSYGHQQFQPMNNQIINNQQLQPTTSDTQSTLAEHTMYNPQPMYNPQLMYNSQMMNTRLNMQHSPVELQKRKNIMPVLFDAKRKKMDN